MQNRLYSDTISKLRAPERLKRLEVERVVELCLEKLFITKVLDVGTGSGIFAEAFSLRNLNVTGIDKNPMMVKASSDLVLNAHFQEATAEQLPFEDNSFDLVFLGHVLHESDDPVTVLREAGRVAACRVAILEWPFCQEEAGPPREHRLPSDSIKKLLRQAEMKDIKKTTLEHMEFFRAKPG